MPNPAFQSVFDHLPNLPMPLALDMATSDWLAIGGGAVAIGVVLGLKHLRGKQSAVEVAAARVGQGEEDLVSLVVETPKPTPAIQGWNQLITDLNEARQQAVAGDLWSNLAQDNPHAASTGLALSSMAQGVVLFDDKLSILFANGAAERFLEASHRQANQQPLAMADAAAPDGFDDDEADDGLPHLTVGSCLAPWLEPYGLTRSVDLVTDGHRAAVVQECMQDPEDPRVGVVRATCRTLPDSRPLTYMLLLEDITQQRVAEQSRHAFIAEATHELRMPLQNIRLYVEQILDLGDSDEDNIERAESMNIINSEVIRLGHMIEEVLSISAVESGALSVQQDDVRMDELLHAVCEEYRAQARKQNIEVSLNLPSKMPVLQADREKLNLALHNVIGNAVKYTPDGGRVTVSVQHGADGMRIDVSDTGIGIPENEQERVFERFYRANDRRVRSITGTGLGLAISREIVRLHGGDIEIQSTVDEGSTFTIVLPPSHVKPASQAA